MTGTDTTTDAPMSQPAHAQPAEPSRQDTVSELLRDVRRGRLMWLWPIPITASIALAGARWGSLGALVATAVIIGLLLFIGGNRLEPGRRLVVAYLVTSAVGLLVAVMAWQSLTDQPSGTGPIGPVDLRGRAPEASELTGLNLRGSQLAGTVLDDRDLTRHDLSGANAPGASFRAANLAGTSLRGTNLRGVDLTDACLRRADLSGAQLAGADVTRADFTDATLPPEWESMVAGTRLSAGQVAHSC